MTFFIVAGQDEPLLRAVVTPLVAKPEQLSFRRRVRLFQADPVLSPKAAGFILAKYNARTGGTILLVRAKKLNKGNRYIAGIPSPEPITADECDALGYQANNGVAVYGYNSGQGDELPFGGSETGVTTALDVAGIPLVVQDCFSGVHLFGVIPGP